jgi:ubiquinone biosynthesis protein COQ9
LYEFQKEKVYTQDQLNSDRKIRAEVREEMIRNECEKFMDLLGELYPKQEFTEKFIEREFTRAGFNKPTSTLSFKKICEYLCSSVNSRFMLGKINGKSALIEKLSPEEVDREFAQIIKKKLMEFENVKIPEQDIKRLVFQENSNARLPPLNHHLKVLKMSFMDYVKGLLAKDE